MTGVELITVGFAVFAAGVVAGLLIALLIVRAAFRDVERILAKKAEAGS